MQVYATKASNEGYTDMLEGIQRRTLVHGGSTLLTEFRLKGGSTLPSHNHSQEQTGYLVSGHMTLTIGGKHYDIKKGDAWIVPGGVEHGASVTEDSVAVEVFSPVREDYL
jgi:quercetin dioxygenase-like cupin family protein